MATLLEQIATIQTLIEKLEDLAFGDDATSVTYSGQTRDSVAKAIKSKFDALQAMVQGRLTYETKALMDAAGAPPAGELAEVWNDPTLENNGLYGWDGVAWQQSNYDPKKQTEKSTTDIRKTLKSQITSDEALVIDKDGKILLGFDEFGRLISDPSILDISTPISKYIDFIYMPTNTDEAYPLVLDRDGRAVVAVDKSGKLLADYDIPESSLIIDTEKKPITEKSNINYDLHGVLTTGQSLGAGYQCIPVLSNTAKYDCLSFANGPRSTKEPIASNFGIAGGTTALVPHVETTVYGMAGGGDVTRYGDTPCTGTAHAIVQYSAKQNGFNWQDNDHQLVSFNSARGSTPLEQLLPATDPDYGGDITEGELFQLLRDQISEAHRLAGVAGKTFALHAAIFIQGEGNASSQVAGVSQAEYINRLRRYRDAINDYAKSVTGQTHDVKFFTYQTFRSSGEQTVIQKAQLDICSDENTYFITPIYHIPMYSIDDGHFSNVGAYIFGQYAGRAYVDAVINGVEPAYLKPVSAVSDGTVVTVKFNVPKRPLVLDHKNLASTTDSGFAVYVDGLRVDLNSVLIGSDGQTVDLTLSTTTSSNDVVVQYAHDYLAVGLTHYGSDESDRANNPASCSGNLRDSTPDTCIAPDNSEHNLWHVAPHFTLHAITI